MLGGNGWLLLMYGLLCHLPIWLFYYVIIWLQHTTTFNSLPFWHLMPSWFHLIGIALNFNGPSYTHTFCFCCKRFCIGFNFAAFLSFFCLFVLCFCFCFFFWPIYFLGSAIQPSVFKMPFEQCWSCPGSQQLLIGSVSRSVLLIKQLSVSTSHYPTFFFF